MPLGSNQPGLTESEKRRLEQYEAVQRFAGMAGMAGIGIGMFASLKAAQKAAKYARQQAVLLEKQADLLILNAEDNARTVQLAGGKFVGTQVVSTIAAGADVSTNMDLYRQTYYETAKEVNAIRREAAHQARQLQNRADQTREAAGDAYKAAVLQSFGKAAMQMYSMAGDVVRAQEIQGAAQVGAKAGAEIGLKKGAKELSQNAADIVKLMDSFKSLAQKNPHMYKLVEDVVMQPGFDINKFLENLQKYQINFGDK